METTSDSVTNAVPVKRATQQGRKKSGPKFELSEAQKLDIKEAFDIHFLLKKTFPSLSSTCISLAKHIR